MSRGAPISKTQRKQAVHELQDMGEALVELSEERLAQVEMPDFLRDAVVAARGITAHGARKRQFQYIGKLMRKVDPAPIRAALDVWRSQSGSHTAAHKRAEAWRERLLNDPDAIGALLAEFPSADVKHLRALIRNALSEREANQPPRSFRELFQALRALFDKA